MLFKITFFIVNWSMVALNVDQYVFGKIRREIDSLLAVSFCVTVFFPFNKRERLFFMHASVHNFILSHWKIAIRINRAVSY